MEGLLEKLYGWEKLLEYEIDDGRELGTGVWNVRLI